MKETLDVLFIDNRDSFVFNLVDEFARRGCKVSTWRNDISVAQAVDLVAGLATPGLVVLSPGPGAPRDAGCCPELIRRIAPGVPVFGVCLGHQVIVEAYGGVVSGGEMCHGKVSEIEHDSSSVLRDLPSPLSVGRYHSLAAEVVPNELRVTATLGDMPMAVEHREFPVVGVQFHPESILSRHGGRIIQNTIDWARENQPVAGQSA